MPGLSAFLLRSVVLTRLYSGGLRKRFPLSPAREAQWLELHRHDLDARSAYCTSCSHRDRQPRGRLWGSVAGHTDHQACSISYRIGGTKFLVIKNLDTYVFTGTPIDEGRVRELPACSLLDWRPNMIFIGSTGTDKTHLCIALDVSMVGALGLEPRTR